MSTEETPEKINRVRTSDAEREQVAEALRNAVTEGRLSLEEGDERLGALYQTKFRDELPSLVADLPQGHAWAAPGPDPDAGGRGPGRGRRGWGPPTGAPGFGGPRFGGPGFGGPAGPGGPDGSPMWRRRHLFRGIRFAVIVAALITFTLITGHFFWPIIPLFFLFQFLRFGAWRRRAMWAGGWAGPGCGHGHGYGPDQGSGCGYGPGYGDETNQWGGRGPGAAA
jgi:hypothetical protein